MSRRSKRRKVSKEKTPEEEPFVYDQKSMQLEVLGVSSIYIVVGIAYGHWNKKNQDSWKSLSDDEKIKKILEKCKGKEKDEYHPLSRCFRKIQFPTIKRIFNTMVDPFHKGRITRETAKWEIIFKFLGEQTPLESRENETKNLKEVGNMEEMLRFITISGKTMPKELLDHILSYLNRNYQVVTNVGAVCQHFYLAILSSWTDVVVSKPNIYKISLLILKSATSITIPDAKKILMKDLAYLFSKLSHNRFRKLSFEYCDSQNSRNVLKSVRKAYEKCEDEANYVFRNVTHVHLMRSSYYGSNGEPWNFQNEVLFPKLVSVEGFSGRLRRHYMWWSNFDNNSKRTEDEKFFVSDETSIRKIGFCDFPETDFLPDEEYPGFNMISELKISQISAEEGRNNTQSKIGKPAFDPLLSKFRNLEVLELHVLTDHRYTYWREDQINKRQLDLAYFFSMEKEEQKLRKLKIHTTSVYSLPGSPRRYYGHDSAEWSASSAKEVLYPPLDFNYNDDGHQITELEIIFNGHISAQECLFDFNMEDLLTKTKLLKSLKSFKCNLPLSTRRRNLDEVFSVTTFPKIIRAKENYLNTIIPILQKEFFESFIFESVIKKYRDCDITVTMGNSNQEFFRVRYEARYKRMRISHGFSHKDGQSAYDVILLNNNKSDFFNVKDRNHVKKYLFPCSKNGMGRIMICMFLKKLEKRMKEKGGLMGEVLEIVDFVIPEETLTKPFFEALGRLECGDFYKFDGISSFFFKL